MAEITKQIEDIKIFTQKMCSRGLLGLSADSIQTVITNICNVLENLDRENQRLTAELRDYKEKMPFGEKVKWDNFMFDFERMKRILNI